MAPRMFGAGALVLPKMDARTRLRDQLAQSAASLVFHLTDHSQRLEEQESHVIGRAIEMKAYEYMTTLIGDGDTRSPLCLYAQEASALLLSHVEELIGSAGGPGEQQVGSASKWKLAPLRTSSSAMTPPPRSMRSPQRSVHGWLEPGTRVLPYVILKDEVIIIGRGREGYENRCSYKKLSSSGKQLLGADPGRGSKDLPSSARFVEVADGRVSRTHCIIKVELREHGLAPVFCIQDRSSNGTYINGNKISSDNRTAVLRNGDRVSLVLSVAPLVEQYFIFHVGDPKKMDTDGSQEWLSSAVPLTPDDRRSALKKMSNRKSIDSPEPKGAGRTATSRYNTKEWTTLDDLQCQICLSVLTNCVALVPCGHNFCAACLSQHFGSLLQGGLPLTCPLRCLTPEKVVVNNAVRNLVQMHEPLAIPEEGPSSQIASSGGDLGKPSEVSSQGLSTPQSRKKSSLTRAIPETPAEDEVEMNVLCPLYDSNLPMDASCLKTRQVDVSLSQLRRTDDSPNPFMAALEALARLSWSDDNIREEVAKGQGIEAMVATMKRFPDKEGIQCNGCLALMSLVRGEGEVCQANQWRVAKAGGVEAIVEAMAQFEEHAMVQLSALLCMIPLALENPMMQAHVADLALDAVCNAMLYHPKEAEVQAKGMVVLGVLAQGDDAVHDAIRYRELEAQAHKHIARALELYGGGSDEVLWAALFSLAVLVKEGGTPFDPACRAATSVGLDKHVVSSLEHYKGTLEESGVEVSDDTILKAGEYLLEVLGPVADMVAAQRRKTLGVTAAVALPCAIAAGYIYLRSR